MLQEGKTYNNLGWSKGWWPGQIFEEIHAQGGGYRKFYTSFDSFFIRTIAYTTARVWGFCKFYDWVNNDPRRLARPDWLVEAGIAGGFLAGVLTNPVEIVFAR